MSRRMLLSTTSHGSLVTWKPTCTRLEDADGVRAPFNCRVVPIQSLEPDGVVSIESLSPAPVVSVTALAPDFKLLVA
jgi:hypothetical protein